MIRRFGSEAKKGPKLSKLVDLKKDGWSRLKLLKQFSGDLDTFKLFFKDNASVLFFTVHDCFCHYDADSNTGKQRASSRTSLPEELDLIFSSFEKILCYLPELVQKRWHFNSILTILRRLLHPNNKLLLKAIGVKLFILWYRILQDEASEMCHQIFASLLPGLGSNSAEFDSSTLSFKQVSACVSQGVQVDNFLPILVDHKPDQQNPYGSLDTLLETFLASMSLDCPQVYWTDPDMHSSSCSFLLTQFLEYYGSRLFPCLNLQPLNAPGSCMTAKTSTNYSNDEQDLDNVDGEWEKATIISANGRDVVSQIGIDVLARCQSTILTWLLRHITISSSTSTRNNVSHDKRGSILMSAGTASRVEDDSAFPAVDGNRDPVSVDGGNGDIMQRSQGSDSGGSSDSCGDNGEQVPCMPSANAISDSLHHSHSITSSLGSASMPSSDRLLLRVLTGDRDMVSAIHTMLRHAYYLPPSHLATVAAVTRTYREWLRKAASLASRRASRLSQSDEDANPDDEFTKSGSSFEENRWTGGLPFDSLVSVFLSSSAAAFSQMGFQNSSINGSQSKLAGGSSGALPAASNREVNNGGQPNNMAYYEVAMYILATCHDLVVSHSATMSRDGWELLLNTLLGFIDCRLPLESEADDSDKRIVRYLIQTLLVTLVRASFSLFVPIPTELWDRASLKLSQLATNQDVLGEWIKCVRKMTELFSMQALEVNWRSAVAAAMASERMTSSQGGRSGRSGFRLHRHPSSSLSNHSHHTPYQQSQAVASAGMSTRRFVERRVPAVSATTVKRPHALQYAPLISPPLVSKPTDRSDATLHFDSRQQSSQRIPSYIVVNTRANRINDFFSTGIRTDDDVSFTLPYAAGSAVHQRLRSLSGNSPQALSSAMSLPPKSPTGSSPLPPSAVIGHSSSTDRIDHISSHEPSSQGGGLQMSIAGDNTKKSQSMGDLTVIIDNKVLSARQSASQEDVFTSPCSPMVVSPCDVEVQEEQEDEEMYNPATSAAVLHVSSAPGPLGILSSPELVGGTVTDTTDTSYSAAGEREIGDDSRPGSALVIGDRTASSLGFCGPEDSNSNALGSERDSYCLNLPINKSMGQELAGSDVASESRDNVNNEEDAVATSKQLSVSIANHSNGFKEDDDEDKEHTGAAGTMVQASEDMGAGIFSRPVLTGGNRLGWTPTSAYVIWRRLLGIIGNPNTSLANDAAAHVTVFRFLSDIARGLIACREAQSLTAIIRPDVFIFVPLFFDSLQSFPLSEPDFLQSNVIAVDVLSRVLCLQHDPELPPQTDFVTAYYLAIHNLVYNHHKPLVSALVHAMNVRFFSSSLPGKTLLFADLAAGCQLVIDGYLEQPSAMTSSFVGGEGGGEFSKLESAISLLGSLLCFTRSHGPEIVCLDPSCEELTETPISCIKISNQIITALLKLSERPVFYGAPRLGQLVVCTLTIFLSHECENALKEDSDCVEHAHFGPVFRQLSSVIRYVPHAVDREGALEVCESTVLSFLHLSNYAKRVLHTRSGEELVRNLVLDLSTILYWLCHHAESCTREAEMRLGCLMTYCLIEWCLAVPLDFLLQTVKFPSGPHALVYKVFKGLTVAATKGSQYPGAVKSATLNEVSNGSLRPENNADAGSTGIASAPLASKSEGGALPKQSQAPSLLQLAARWALAYLLQHLGLYPYSASPPPTSTGINDTSFGGIDGNLENDSSPVQFIALHGQSIISVHADEEAMVSQNNNSFGFNSTSWSLSEKCMSLSIRDISGNYSWTSQLVCSHQSSCADDHSWLPPSQETPWRSLVEVSTEKFVGSATDISKDSKAAGDAPESSDTTTTTTTTNEACSKCRFLNILNEIKAATYDSSSSSSSTTVDENTKQQQQPGSFSCEVEEAVSHCADVEDRFMREDWFQGETVAPPSAMPVEASNRNSVYQQLPTCLLTRLFMESLGWLSAGHGGSDIVHLRSSESFFRDLRHLDHMKSDTHKVAVAYVARGQEDSSTVLRNSSGSPEYESFVAGLGWNVPVGGHFGFLGGVARDGSYGNAIPYFGSATAEVAFHVATMISPGSSVEETVRKRTKHLGNDEVQVIWSEHWRKYKRDVIPGDFGDVIIVIHPLSDLGLYQVHIERKHGPSHSDQPHLVIGPPLYNGAVLDATTLATAVRSTVIGASRSLAFARPHYRPFFAERYGHIQYVIHKYRQAEGLANFVTELSFASSGTSVGNATTVNTPSVPTATTANPTMVQPQQQTSTNNNALSSMLSNYSLLQLNDPSS